MVEPLPLVFDKDILGKYDFGRDHPFRGGRFDSFLENLANRLGENSYDLYRGDPVSEQEPFRIADEDYVEFSREFYNSLEQDRDSARFDKYHSRDNFPGRRSDKLELAARGVLGQARKACDLVQKDGDVAVSVGGGFHHAKPGSGEGFCIYNDVAYAVKYLREEKGVEKVMVLDTDAHAGNGTYEYFSRNPEVLQVDLHQDPSTIYPGTGYAEEIGQGKGEGFTVNVPLPRGAGDASLEFAFEEIVGPVTKEFAPEIIIRNGGGDPYSGDPLTNLGASLAGLNLIGRRVEGLRQSTGSKLVDLIVSGYTGEELHDSWIALIAGLMEASPAWTGQEPDGDDSEAPGKTKSMINRVKRHHDDHWNF